MPLFDWMSSLIPVANSAKVTISSTVALSSVQIIAANPSRKGLYLYNNSANTVYLSFGQAANSNTSCTIPVPTFTTFVLAPVIYTGAIFGIRNAGTGTVICTELS